MCCHYKVVITNALLHVTESSFRALYDKNLWQYFRLELKPPLKITSSKSAIETLEKDVKYVPCSKLTIKTPERSH